MKSSYQLRSITDRTSLSNGTILNSNLQGPSVRNILIFNHAKYIYDFIFFKINSNYPLGSFIQDYIYSSASGDLDEYNGRWCVTPEYPNGTYAYFVSTDDSGNPKFPYVVGFYYYGNVASTSSTTVSIGATKYF